MTIMGVRAVSPDSVLLPVGGRWVLEVEATDDEGVLVDAVVTAVVTLPDNTTASPVVENTGAGRYRAVYVTEAAGRHVARLSTADDVADFAAHALAVTAGTGMPDVPAVVGYLGATSHTDPEIQSALDAEADDQRSRCRVGAVYPPALREALLRRVARNLEMRKMPLAVLQGDAEVGSTVLPGRDPEVRRLEAPHRKLVMG